MNICVIGTGYVGLVTGTCFAEMGNDVICVDNNIEKLNALNQAIIPIYEPGLEDLIKTNLKENRLNFTNDLKTAVEKSQICFITVGTPSNEQGNVDLSAIKQVIIDIAKSINNYKIIVNKSTIPIGTLECLAEEMKKYTTHKFDIASNPEFLKQGAALEDFLKPDRVIIGANSENAINTLKQLYSPFVRNGNPIITMDIKSAEMTKYAANAFLALKISYINEIANICEKIGADIECVRKGITSDSRIGKQFLFPGLGYGGSCFPKDIRALTNIAQNNDYCADLLKATDAINQYQRKAFVQKIMNRFSNNLEGKRFAVWGLSFKPKTDDMRDAPSITIIKDLLSKGATICAYDPKAISNAQNIFGNSIKYADSSYDALDQADALLLLTEWNEFRNPDLSVLKEKLNNPIIFDGRNQYSPKILKEFGIEYHYIGKK